MKRATLIFILFISIIASLYSQNYSIGGDAFGILPFSNSCPSDTCFTLTPDLGWKAGSVYNKELFDLTKPFDGTFCLFLGSKDANGADGIAFILKDTNTALLGLSGGGMGYGSLSPSIAIEFDTWDNAGNDIFADHTCLTYNGNSFVPITPSIPLLPSGANVEDGMPHTARIVWIPQDTTLYMFFDGFLRFTHKVDLINSIFGGKNLVNWGFTSSTGGSANLQQICFPTKKSKVYYDTVCETECVDFIQESKDSGSYYSWNNGISDTVPNVRICPDSTTTYLLFEQNKLTGIIDTIYVVIVVEKNPILNLGNDFNLCEGTALLNANLIGAKTYLWNDGSNSDNLVVSDIGIYWVEVNTSFCNARDSIKVTCLEIPNVFSPNGDGINDYFSPIDRSDLFEGSFHIYNRWGVVVFESSDLNSIRKGWDGKLNDKSCSDGVYYFTFSYKENANSESINIKGALNLFR